MVKPKKPTGKPKMSATAPAPTPKPDDLANAAIEQLAEDESLRGDLTDNGYTPLQSWAFARLQAVAREAVHHPDPQAAMDGFMRQIRGFVQDAVTAATNGALGDLPATLHPRIVLAADVPKVQAALHALKLGNDADANAQAIAGALAPTVSAPSTTPVPSAPSTKP